MSEYSHIRIKRGGHISRGWSYKNPKNVNWGGLYKVNPLHIKRGWSYKKLRLNYLHFHLQIYLHYHLQSIAAKLSIFEFFLYLMPIPHKIWSLVKKKF